VKTVFLEAILVGCSGLAIALAANALSPHGLKLTRDYSPGRVLFAAHASGTTNSQTAGETLASQFRAEGLQLADSNQVSGFFADPAREAGNIIFVDARDDDHFQAGHIPGAYQLDHYHPEKYLSGVLPVCGNAQTIVVYCKGGSCEDSEQTAIFLRDSGVPVNKLFVYAGGFDEWTTNRMPVELGLRGSGQLQDNKPASVNDSSAPK
jgi:rhodanese-related sulfurtransferase